MNPQNNIQVYQSPEALTKAAADFILALANDCVASNGRFTISLSGGHTPQHLYELMAKPPYSDRMPWKNTYIFWGDERCVALDDKDNNALMAKTALLDKIDIPADNIKRIPVNLPPPEAATVYEQTIKDTFGNSRPVFDLVLLGLGENGHTASLFPGTDVLHEQHRLVKEVYVAEQHMFRITMTYPLINSAGNIMFLAEGSAKAAIINEVIAGVDATKYPSQLIAPADGKLYWFLDDKAAAQLPAAVLSKS